MSAPFSPAPASASGIPAHLPAVDLLKGVAILMVVLVHAGQMLPALPVPVYWVTGFAQNGSQLFFLLSGFTLALAWENGRYQNVKSFYIQRLWSIVPGYELAILLYCFLTPWVASLGVVEVYMPQRFWLGALVNGLLLNGVVPAYNNNIVVGGWFVGTIVWFYVLFPALIGLARHAAEKRRFFAPPLAALGISFALQLALALVADTFALSAGNGFLYFSLLNQLPCLLLGVMLYYHWRALRKIGAQHRTLWLLLGAGFLGAGFLLNLLPVPLRFVLIPFLCALGFYWLFLLLVLPCGNTAQHSATLCKSMPDSGASCKATCRTEKNSAICSTPSCKLQNAKSLFACFSSALAAFLTAWGKISYEAFLLNIIFSYYALGAAVTFLQQRGWYHPAAALLLLIPMYVLLYVAALGFHLLIKKLVHLLRRKRIT